MILAGERYEKVPTWSGRHTQLPRNCNAFDEVVCLDNTGRLTQDFVPWGAFVIILSSFKKWTGGKSSIRSQTTYLCLICLKIEQERRRLLSGITPHFVAHFNPWWKTWKVTKWLGKASLIPKVNSNERMIGTFDKTVCQGESEFKRVLKMFRLCCRSCVLKSLKDSRLTARFLWQQTFRYIYHYTELDLSLWLQFYRFQHRQSVHLLPRWDDTCLKWRTPKLGGKHVATSVGQIAMCHLRAFGRKMFHDLAMFGIVLKCFPEPDSCRHVQFAFGVPRFVPGNVCLKRSTNPS